MDIKREVESIREYIVNLRREFHKFPEPSGKEFETSKKIKKELKGMSIDFKTIAGTGTIATIKGEKKGKTIALRSDIDALEIEELNDFEYKSEKKGLMHACGHDGHMAMLFGALKILNRYKSLIKGEIKAVFQPAEELGEGAKDIMDDGGIEGVDNIFGIHLWSGIPTGKIGFKTGEQMASADLFRIKVKGKGGHGSMPNQGVDAGVVSSAIVMNLQTIVSREINPLETVVVSVGKIVSGTRYNIIPHEGILEGTVRCFNPEIRKTIPERIKRVAENTAKTYRAKASIEYVYGPPPLINEKSSVELAKETVKKLFDQNTYYEMDKIPAAEDFAYYLEKIPGVFVFVGSGNKNKQTDFPHHHPKFNIDEESLLIGAMLHIGYALEFLNE